jgi:allene oxide cyclase
MRGEAMKRLLVLPALAAAGILTFAVVSGGAGTSGHRGKVIHVIEHATTDTVTDTGPAGDSAGDVLTFANDVFNASDSAKVGSDQGYCIRTEAGVSWECNYTTFLARGQIVVEGPFYDAADSTLAITGGTGAYRKARGQLELKSRNGGTEFDFIFHLSG